MSSGPDRLRELVRPETTAVVTMELQKGVVGDDALLPALPSAVREAGLLDVAALVCSGARARGMRIVHAVVEHRPDGIGQPVNCKLFALAAKRRAELGSLPTDSDQPGVALVDELDAQPDDILVSRLHGITPFTGTELDSVLRSLDVRTIVLLGVSLNLGIMGAALSAVDLGYRVVIVRDGVVGIPTAYADAVLENSLSLVATIVPAADLLAAWE